MRAKLFLSSALLGVLSAFAAWSVHWAITAHQDVTYEMPGPVTTLSFSEGPQGVDDAEPTAITEDLSDFIDTHSLALVIGSGGDGPPQMVVEDPDGVLPWYAPAESAAAESPQGSAHVFEGTYSQHRWEQGRPTPLVPESAEILGTMRAPSGAEDLQSVRTLEGSGPPSGDYILNTDDPDELAEFESILARSGLEVRAAQQIPLGQYLVQDPLLGATGLLLVSGALAALLFWTLGVWTHKGEFVIRMRHGATHRKLALQVWSGGASAQILGVVLGVALSGAVVALVGRETPGQAEYLVMCAGAAAGLVVAGGAWLAAAAAGTRVRSGVGRAS